MLADRIRDLAAVVARLLASGAQHPGSDEAFRRQAEALRPFAVQVPAARVLAEGVERATTAPPSEAVPAVLDLLVRVRQANLALGGAGLGGELQAAPESGPWSTSTGADVYPVADALPGKGNRTAKVGRALATAAGDLRCLQPLWAALTDRSAALADLVADEGLPPFGRAIAAELAEGIDLRGKAADARRLRALCRADREAGRGPCFEALERGSTVLRVAALKSLPFVADAAEVEEQALCFIRDADSPVRLAALDALRHCPSAEATEAIIGCLDSFDGIAEVAISILTQGRHPHARTRLMASVAGLIDTPIAEQRGPRLRQRLRGLQGLPDRMAALPELLGFARHRDDEVRAAVLWALGGFPEAADSVLPFLIDGLSAGPVVAGAVAESCLRFGPAARPALAALRRCAEQASDFPLLHALFRAVAGAGVGDPETVAWLVGWLKDPRKYAREAAAAALNPLAAGARPHLNELVDYAMNNPFPHRLLVGADPEGTATATALLPYFQNPTPALAQRVLWLLTEYHDRLAALAPVLVPALRPLLTHPVPPVPTYAESALRTLGAM